LGKGVADLPAFMYRLDAIGAESASDFLLGPWGIGTAGGAETEHFDTK